MQVLNKCENPKWSIEIGSSGARHKKWLNYKLPEHYMTTYLFVKKRSFILGWCALMASENEIEKVNKIMLNTDRNRGMSV